MFNVPATPDDSDAEGTPWRKSFPARSLWSQKCWALSALFISFPLQRSQNSHAQLATEYSAPPRWCGWVGSLLTWATRPNLLPQHAQHLDKSGPRAAASMPNSRAPLGGEEVRHQVRGPASDPYPNSRQILRPLGYTPPARRQLMEYGDSTPSGAP